MPQSHSRIHLLLLMHCLKVESCKPNNVYILLPPFCVRHFLIHVLKWQCVFIDQNLASQIAMFMGPTWAPPGSYLSQMGPMLAPWTLLSGVTMSYLPPFIQIAVDVGPLMNHRGHPFWCICRYLSMPSLTFIHKSGPCLSIYRKTPL